MTNSPSYLPSGYCSSSASLTANSPMGVVRRPTVNGPFLPRMVRNVSWPGTTMGRTDLVGADVGAMMVLLGNRGKGKAPLGALPDQNEAANAGACSSTSPAGSRSAGLTGWLAAVSAASLASDAGASWACGASACAWPVG